MASAAAARGPIGLLLQNTAGQYCVLGLGIYTLFPEKFHKLSSLVQLIASDDDLNSKSSSNGPIIIHTPSPTVIGGGGNGRGTWVGTIAYAAAGAGACWAGYMVAVQVLPDAVSQFLPVTRKIYDKTSQSLGKGILTCKQVLEEKIAHLSGQTEDLSLKQDETIETVSHIKSELGEARMDLNLLQSIMKKCEGSLDKSDGVQQYTLRGVRLLVRCVASMLPHDVETVDELARFIEEQEKNTHLLSQDPNSPESNILTTPSSERRPIITPLRRTPSNQSSTNSTASPDKAVNRQPSLDIVTPTEPAKRTVSQSFKEASMGDKAIDAFTDIRSLLGH